MQGLVVGRMAWKAALGNGFFFSTIFKTVSASTSFLVEKGLILWTIHRVVIAVLLIAASESLSPHKFTNFSQHFVLPSTHAADVAHDADQHPRHKEHKQRHCNFHPSAVRARKFDLVRVLVLGLARNRHLIQWIQPAVSHVAPHLPNSEHSRDKAMGGSWVAIGVVGWQQGQLGGNSGDNLNYMQGQQEEAKDFQKIILVGDASTGKTHIAYTFVRDKPPTNIMPTVAVEFSSKSLVLDNGRKVRVQTWDTAGQEAYRSITMNHYRKANGAFIVFDVSRRSSFQHVAYWLQNLREKGEAGMQIGLIGHKIDSGRREVSSQQGEQLAVKERLLYAETTINDPVSIALAFKRLANSILQAQSESVGRGGGQLRLNQGGNAESGCSC